MASTLPLITALAVIALAALRPRLPAAAVTPAHALVAVGGIALAAWALLSGAASAPAALMAAATALIGAGAPASLDGRAVRLSSLGFALGPAVAALGLAQLDAPIPALTLGEPVEIIALGAATCATLGAAVLGLRAAAFSADREGPGGPNLAPHLLTALALLALAFFGLNSGGQGFVAMLPLAGSEGTPALWMTNVHTGVQAAIPDTALGGVILAALFTAAAGAVLRRADRLPAVIAAAAGVAALAAFGVLVGAHMTPATLDQDAARTLLAGLGVDPALVDNPRLLAVGPYHVDVRLAPGPLALLATAGLGALGAAADALRTPLPRKDRDADALEIASLHDLLRALAARDAIFGAAALAWVALVAFAVLDHHRAGVWLLNAPPQHLLAGVALGVSAALCALYSLGGRSGPWFDLARAALIATTVALAAGALAGGLVGPAGVFGL